MRRVSQIWWLLFALVAKLSSTSHCELPSSNEHMKLLTDTAVREGPGQHVWWTGGCKLFFSVSSRCPLNITGSCLDSPYGHKGQVEAGERECFWQGHDPARRARFVGLLFLVYCSTPHLYPALLVQSVTFLRLTIPCVCDTASLITWVAATSAAMTAATWPWMCSINWHRRHPEPRTLRKMQHQPGL